MNFVPSLGWFTAFGGSNQQKDPQIVLDDENWSSELILYQKVLRDVNRIKATLILLF